VRRRLQACALKRMLIPKAHADSGWPYALCSVGRNSLLKEIIDILTFRLVSVLDDDNDGRPRFLGGLTCLPGPRPCEFSDHGGPGLQGLSWALARIAAPRGFATKVWPASGANM
jgi:hypothetical protein